MFEKVCVPYAPTLIESMRSIGYSFPSAIADLLDNSVSVHAKHIDILTNPSSDPFLVILDDGDGMTKEKLYEAMRYGSSNPLAERATDDLGRFGLGLKAASLSQCRRLVVVSKCNIEINACAWDLDYVIQKGVWALQCFDEKELAHYPYIDRLKVSQQGTYDTWYEVKTIPENATQVTISSLEQLEADTDGHLIIVRLEDSNAVTDNTIALNTLVASIVNLIDDPEIIDLFRSKLDNMGYCPDVEYDKYNYILKSVCQYKITSTFPRLRRKNTDPNIANVKYSILLNGIRDFLED